MSTSIRPFNEAKTLPIFFLPFPLVCLLLAWIQEINVKRPDRRQFIRTNMCYINKLDCLSLEWVKE